MNGEFNARCFCSGNYLLKEMGYQVAQKHANKLRRYAMFLGLIAPVALLFAAPVAYLCKSYIF